MCRILTGTADGHPVLGAAPDEPLSLRTDGPAVQPVAPAVQRPAHGRLQVAGEPVRGGVLAAAADGAGRVCVKEQLGGVAWASRQLLRGHGSRVSS